MEYEYVIQIVDCVRNKTFFNHTFIFRKQFYFIFSILKIIGHGNPDSNLESLCVFS
jgi:hypothetical protein